MALTPVSHKPLTGQARQFDGTLPAFLDILGARSMADVSVTLTYDAAAACVSMQLSGGEIGGGLLLASGDWIVFPDDQTQPPIALSAAHASDRWQVSG